MELKQAIEILSNLEEGDHTSLYEMVQRAFDDLNLTRVDQPGYDELFKAQTVFLGWVLEKEKEIAALSQ